MNVCSVLERTIVWKPLTRIIGTQDLLINKMNDAHKLPACVIACSGPVHMIGRRPKELGGGVKRSVCLALLTSWRSPNIPEHVRHWIPCSAQVYFSSASKRLRVRNVTLAKHRLPGWSDLMNLSEKQNSEQPNQRINCWDYKANFDPVYIWISVHWVQQQHEKRRAKRDYPDPSFPAFGDYPSFFGTGSQDQQHQPQYRGISPHNVFPDPLFKEQWYLSNPSGKRASWLTTEREAGNAKDETWLPPSPLKVVLAVAISARSPTVAEDFSIASASRPALDPIQPPIEDNQAARSSILGLVGTHCGDLLAKIPQWVRTFFRGQSLPTRLEEEMRTKIHALSGTRSHGRSSQAHDDHASDRVATAAGYLHGIRQYSSCSFLTSALDGGEWLASRPGRALPSGKDPSTHWIGGWVGPRAGLDVEDTLNILSFSRGSNLGCPVRNQDDWGAIKKVSCGLMGAVNRRHNPEQQHRHLRIRPSVSNTVMNKYQSIDGMVEALRRADPSSKESYRMSIDEAN
ncbi:Furin-like protease 2 [Zootermopsis nevadensis]|uniref:Furin-like protease 2 n=1 Tax=Zootermopsis nevadensis TaxID=136037 RepID=A0A067RHZ2_ZOONE|nr:Furin-like protease 2 [Zootermopsis nevadensis]